MIALAFIMAAFVLFSLGVVVGMILNAPLAYEDREGFRFGEPPRYYRKIGNTFEPIGEPED